MTDSETSHGRPMKKLVRFGRIRGILPFDRNGLRTRNERPVELSRRADSARFGAGRKAFGAFRPSHLTGVPDSLGLQCQSDRLVRRCRIENDTSLVHFDVLTTQVDRRFQFSTLLPSAISRRDQGVLVDESEDAFGRSWIVARIAHYGERWGRHWVRPSRVTRTPNRLGRECAYERVAISDYVVHSSDEDKPYDQF